MANKRVSNSIGNRGSKKRRTITLAEKLEIIRRSEGGQKISFLARELGLSASTVNTIIKDKTRIKEHVKNAASLKSTVLTKKRSGVLYKMEELLVLWINDHLRKNMSPSLMAIQKKARSLYEDLKKESGEDVGSFMASHGWFSRFKQRANLHNLKVSTEATSSDENLTAEEEEFRKILTDIIKEGCYIPNQIFKLSETGLFWKKMPDRSCLLSNREEKIVANKLAAESRRLTLLLGGNVLGDCKLKPLLVYHEENPRALRGIDKEYLPVVWKSNPKACVNTPVFEEYFWEALVKELKGYCESQRIQFKILLLLILDNASWYPLHLDDYHPNIKVVYLPPNAASLLQPMNQEIIATFKAYYIRNVFAQAVAATENGMPPTEFWEGYNIYDGIKNIADAWEDVKAANMHGAWKKICPQFVQRSKGFEEDVTEDAINKTVEYARQLQLDIDVEDVEYLLESQQQLECWTGEGLTNDDLEEAQTSVEEDNEEDKEPESVEPKQFTTKKMAEAFSLIKVGLAILEKQDSNLSRFLQVNRAVQKDLSCYKAIYEEKKRTFVRTSLSNEFVKEGEQSSHPSVVDSTVSTSTSVFSIESVVPSVSMDSTLSVPSNSLASAFLELKYEPEVDDDRVSVPCCSSLSELNGD